MRGLVAMAGAVSTLGMGIWLAAQPAGAVPPSAEAGADIAARWCAGCHVVAPSGAGTDAAPSFVSIAQRRTPDQLRAFLAKPHAKPMRGFTLSGREIDDVAAYIATLGPRQPPQ
ncbi:MAG: cytochrome c [Magnetospirillum sp.]|nr:cytochrome c [Magnetospirillum sp.]